MFVVTSNELVPFSSLGVGDLAFYPPDGSIWLRTQSTLVKLNDPTQETSVGSMEPVRKLGIGAVVTLTVV